MSSCNLIIQVELASMSSQSSCSPSVNSAFLFPGRSFFCDWFFQGKVLVPEESYKWMACISKAVTAVGPLLFNLIAISGSHCHFFTDGSYMYVSNSDQSSEPQPLCSAAYLALLLGYLRSISFTACQKLNTRPFPMWHCLRETFASFLEQAKSSQ